MMIWTSNTKTVLVSNILNAQSVQQRHPPGKSENDCSTHQKPLVA